MIHEKIFKILCILLKLQVATFMFKFFNLFFFDLIRKNLTIFKNLIPNTKTLPSLHTVLNKNITLKIMLMLLINLHIFQINAPHLLTACIMTAPCGLLLSKLQFPETKKSKYAHWKDIKSKKTRFNV